MTTSLTIRMDEGLKAEAEELFDDLGLSMTAAITCFLKKAVSVGAIPFAIRRTSKRQEMLDAIAEARRLAADPSTPSCSDPDKLEEFLFS